MSTHCAPCIADLALLREAKTTISGTAACVAHAVLLLHPGDTPQQRLARLAELRSNAEGKLATASADDVPDLELLIQEYALAGAMDMTVPLRDLAGERSPRPPKNRNRGRDRDRGERGDRGDRGGRERGPRPERSEPPSETISAPPPADAPPADAPAGSPAQTPADAPSAAVAETPAPAPAEVPSERPAEPAAEAPPVEPAAVPVEPAPSSEATTG